jgi:C4-dicarboxylate-specific signal transduction histidine kinase
VTDLAKPHDVPVDSSAPTASFESILCTEELQRRPSRPPDYEKENQSLGNRVPALLGGALFEESGNDDVAFVLDLSEQKRAESALRRSEASIAHELNQPLSGIITNASTCLRMLAADPPNVEGARETARRIIRDGNRASEVITRLRALFSKKDTATECVNLNEAALEVITLSLADLQKNGVTLSPELADDLPLVTGDRIQLQQVILNLVLNASDAMSGVDDRPRKVVIRTEREDDRARLTVQDVGVGIEPSGAEKLFEPFYTTKSGGMGIGLSLSRSIIESHHGRLWATMNDGPGAAFSFSIPRAPEAFAHFDGLGDSQAPGEI